MPRTLNQDTVASNPGRFELSHDRLKDFHPELFSAFDWKCFLIGCRNLFAGRDRESWLEYIAEHLEYGDSRAAVVVATSPKLVVAAYTDELDCVALLEFERKVAKHYNLKEGDRLLAVNTYDPREDETEPDLVPGSASRGRYRNFAPCIADFLTDDAQALRERKGEISEAEWERTWSLGCERATAGQPVRSGEPLFCTFSRRAATAGPGQAANHPWLKKYAVNLAAAAFVVLMACAAVLIGGAFSREPFEPRDVSRLNNSAKIYLVPINDFPTQTLEELARHYHGKYGTPVEVKPTLRTPPIAYDAERRQLIAEEVTDLLRRAYPFARGNREPVLIGVTSDDMYISKLEWRYAYSYRGKGAAIVSSARMGRAALLGFGEPNDEQRVGRLRKMITKNIGIMYYRLPQSDDPHSVLYRDVGGPRELDRMGEDF